jgi:chromosome segregation ATPase
MIVTEIGQMTVTENGRLEEAMASLTTQLQDELERVTHLERKNNSFRQQCEELNKQNLELVSSVLLPVCLSRWPAVAVSCTRH